MNVSGLFAQHIDVETAFLHECIDEKIGMMLRDEYLVCLKYERGKDYSEDERCRVLVQPLYGIWLSLCRLSIV